MEEIPPLPWKRSKRPLWRNFWIKLPGGLPAADRKKCRRYYRCLFTATFQQGSPVHRHRRTTCYRPHGEVHVGPNLFRRATRRGTAPAHGRGVQRLCRLMVDYICRHREPVKLLLCCAEGTSYENFIHNMVEVEVESTLRYMGVLRRMGRDIPQMSDPCAISSPAGCSTPSLKWLSTICYEQALRDVEQLQTFLYGWLVKTDGGMIPYLFENRLVFANFKRRSFHEAEEKE